MENKQKDNATNATHQQSQIVIPINNPTPVKWICEVCGYANPEYTALCKKCSNYLQRS